MQDMLVPLKKYLFPQKCGPHHIGNRKVRRVHVESLGVRCISNLAISSLASKILKVVQTLSIQSSVQTCKIFGIEFSSPEQEHWPNVNTPIREPD